MGNLPSYSVIITGGLKDDVDLLQVQQAFADIFKISTEKASTIIGSKKIIKKDTDFKTAQTYQQKLEKIGLVVALREQLPSPSASPKIALEPTEEEITLAKEADQASKQIMFTCPKCQLKQIKSEQCEGCGAYVHKLLKTSEYSDVAYEQSNQMQSDVDTVVYEVSSFNSKAFIAAAVAALLGALLWAFIAVQFDYELGMIAWLIGGAVGFAAAAFNSQGKTAGFICGVLTLLAILGGKYMGMEYYKSEIVSAFSSNAQEIGEEMSVVFQQQKTAAEAFSALPSDDESLHQFIVEYQYGEDYTVADLTTEDVDFFIENTQPELEAFSSNPPEYEQWLNDTLYGGMEKISSVDLIKENFGFIDVIFLFLGIGTAFRLGSSEEVSLT